MGELLWQSKPLVYSPPLNYNSMRFIGEIWFYNNPVRFHRLYRNLIEASSLKDRIRLFTHLQEIQKKRGKLNE